MLFFNIALFSLYLYEFSANVILSLYSLSSLFSKIDFVIKVRNEFIHRYFLHSLFFGDWSYPYDKVSDMLTKVLFLIHESNDWISNKIDNGHRPTILD